MHSWFSAHVLASTDQISKKKKKCICHFPQIGYKTGFEILQDKSQINPKLNLVTSVLVSLLTEMLFSVIF